MPKNFIIVCAFILFIQSSAFGDVIYLNNGRNVEGKITEETDKTVTLKVKIGEIVFKREEIKSIEKKELPSDFFGDAGGSGTLKKETQVAGLPETQKFRLSIKAEYKRLLSGDAIVVEGTTDLPPKSVLIFALKKETGTIETRRELIKKSPFSLKLGQSSGKQIVPGSYVVEAIFSPEAQEDDGVRKKVKGAQEIKAEYEVTVGSADEAGEIAERRKLELISQIKEAGRIYDEMTREYETQKGSFDKAGWNASVLKWQSKINNTKSSIVNYRARAMSFGVTLEEDALNEVTYSLEMLMNRYTEELYKANNLNYDLSEWAKTKDIGTLNKEIKERLAALNGFVEKSER